MTLRGGVAPAHILCGGVTWVPAPPYAARLRHDAGVMLGGGEGGVEADILDVHMSASDF